MNLELAQSLCQQARVCLLESHQIEENGTLLAEAGTLYLQAVHQDPTLAEPYLGLAMISYSAGQQPQALALLRQAQELEPYNLKAQQMLRRMQKQAAPAPFKKTAVRVVERFETVEPQATLFPVKTAPRIQDNLGQQKGCVQAGPQINLLQQALQALGFELELNGSFDRKTLKALQAYQYRLKQPVTGCTDSKLNQRLNQILERLESDPDFFKSKDQTAPSGEAAEILSDTEAGEPNPVKLSHSLGPEGVKGCVTRGPEVRLLQETLVALGFSLEMTWQFDPATSRAVRLFQSRHRIPLTGQVDQKTRDTLNPLIEVSLRTRECLEDMRNLIQQYWLDQGFLPVAEADIWGRVCESFLTELLAPFYGEELESIDFPTFRPKPLIEQTLGSKDLAEAISEGEIIRRLQEMLLAQGQTLQVTGQFDLQTLVALRKALQALNLPPDETVHAGNREIFNHLLKQQYERESIREQLLLKVKDWCHVCQIPWHRGLQQQLETRIFPLLERKRLPAMTREPGPPGRQGKVSSGPEVAILQYLLVRAGQACVLSGQFDPQTQKALKSWQRAQHLPESGLVDAQTLKACNDMLANSVFD